MKKTNKTIRFLTLLLSALVFLTSVGLSGCHAASADVIGFSDAIGNTVRQKHYTDSFSFAVTGSESSTNSHFQALSMETEEMGILHYWLYTPSDTTEQMPLIVYLHSASGKGDNLNQLLTTDGFPKYLSEGLLGDLRAYVLIPQLPTSQRGWVNVGSSVIELIDKTINEYSIDKNNISMTGHSVGGTGTWNIAIAYPEKFNRIAPLSGSVRASADSISALKHISVRAFVGSEDTIIDPVMSQRMVDALKTSGSDAEITVFDSAAHEDVPELTYCDQSIDIVSWLLGSSASNGTGVSNESNDSGNDGMNMYSNNDFIEKEQPELTEETKQLISAYQRKPNMENYLALRDIVIENYNAVLERKEAKLAELKEETAGKPGGEEKVAEMEEIVQEMYITYWNRINSSMLRFTDSRLLKWKISEAANYDYIPVMGAGNTISVKRTPVTNAEYAAFVTATGHAAPSNWVGGIYPEGEDDYPVNFVSYDDALAYCAWLTEQDASNIYRMPNESEWELAAGHMPKDADFNCGVNNGRVSVEEYAGVTRGAHGGIDFWGNVWEWTSTVRSIENGNSVLGVKGGSWKSPRTDCRTEHRIEGRVSTQSYDDVGFRVIRVDNGAEPEQKVELYTLDTPKVTAVYHGDTIQLDWTPIDGAVEYQVFEYKEETNLIYMLDRTGETSYIVNKPPENTSYIVQALSYTEISDNVHSDYAVKPIDQDTYILGDADGDGYVTILDVTVIQRRLASLPVALFVEKAADVTGDGLDITDATNIQRHLAEMDVPYRIGEQKRWVTT